MMSKRFSAIFGLALVLAGGVAMARELKLKESAGVQQYWGSRSNSTSSNPVSGIMTSFSVMVTGGTGEFRVHHATGTGTGFNVNSSSTIYLTDGVSYNDTPDGILTNPMIEITRLDNGATVYLDIGYLAPRMEGF